MKNLFKLLFALIVSFNSFGQQGFPVKFDTTVVKSLQKSALDASTIIKEGGNTNAKISARIESGDLVKVGIASLAYQTSYAGAGTYFSVYSLYTNGDGSGQGVTLTTTSAGLGSNRISIYTSVWGKTIGFRFRRRSDSPAFSVIIDGTPYDVPSYLIGPRFQNEAGSTDRECLWIVAENLKQGLHSVEVNLYPSATDVKQLVVYGFVTDKYAGYSDQLPNDFIIEKGILPTTSTSILKPFGINGIKKVGYVNTTATEITATITYETAAIVQEKIAANSTKWVDISNLGLMVPAAPSTTAAMSHSASATGLNYFIIGR